jgi:hypothetical protein
MGWLRVVAVVVAWAVGGSAWADCRFYRDRDGDLRGVASESQIFLGVDCGDLPDGWALVPGDCNDADASVHPGHAELCDGVDNDCDGGVDEGLSRVWYYVDGDADGWGRNEGPTARYQCPRPSGYAVGNGDCNDWDAATYPGAPEQCDGRDNDCDGVRDDGLVVQTARVDADGDGHGDGLGASLQVCEAPAGYALSGDDCDDADASVHPGAPETCDGEDEDCTGVADDGGRSAWWDGDGDGHGDPTLPITVGTCDAGGADVGDDCDDADATSFPGAGSDACDDHDNDCDGQVDEDAWFLELWPDADGDGFRGDGGAVSSCHDLPGTVWFEFDPGPVDCDDLDAAVNPDAIDDCGDGVDDDCDGAPDNEAVLRFRDRDGDGWGDVADLGQVFFLCAPDLDLTGWGPHGDCDDADHFNHPDGFERCDGRDNDCDGEADEGAWLYSDADGDGWGDAAAASAFVPSCGPGEPGYARPGDCDDADDLTYPGAFEDCRDGWDNNCDLVIDRRFEVVYPDLDGDGWGDPAAIPVVVDVCEPGWTSAGLAYGDDCDDADPEVHVGAAELCNGVDDDCDGERDEGWLTGPAWPDVDGDGYGDLSAPALEVCSPPFGYARDGGDCDDVDGAVHPGAVDDCDGGDEDCDGLVDEDVELATLWYPDGDGDGFGAWEPAVVVGVCTSPPPGHTLDEGDCDDAAATVFPDAPEVCDGLDNDCDGAPDDGFFVSSFWPDADGDGFGDDAAAPSALCAAPPGWASEAGDCDDVEPAVHPGAFDDCDGGDEDCDGNEDWSAGLQTDTRPDADGDGYGAWHTLVARGHCEKLPTGWVTGTTEDCNDGDASVSPAAFEQCNGVDDDCDGDRDEGWARDHAWPDADGDGYGDDAAPALWVCAPPLGYARDGGDCDDAAAAVNPGAFDDCDGGDENCDGVADWDAALVTVWFLDADEDGFGRSDVFNDYGHCAAAPATFAPVSGDCDDAAWAVHPGALERCDGADDDCDGVADEGWPQQIFHFDGDGDSYGSADAVQACAPPLGYVENDHDCDDADALVHPGAYDDCEGGDENCDGVADWDAAAVQVWYFDGDEDGWGDWDETLALGHCDLTTGWSSVPPVRQAKPDLTRQL